MNAANRPGVPVEAEVAPAEWLVAEPVVERLQLDDASWVDVVRGLVPRADAVHDELKAHAKWEQGRVFRYERWIDEPRLTSWTAGSATHPALREVQDWISRRYRVSFDGVALALYRDGRDSVAWHRPPITSRSPLAGWKSSAPLRSWSA